MAMKKSRPVQLFESKDAADLLRAGTMADVRKDAYVDREPVELDAGDVSPPVSFVITDQSEDRYGDVVAADGWDFTSYNRNPVLLWAHDYCEPPVGKMGEPKVVGKKVKATVAQWVPQELSPFAAAVEGMVRQGFLSAVSVGFRPSEFTFTDAGGVNYLAQELLEVSVVPVPANPNALVAAKSAGLWVPEIERWVGKTLDEKKPGAAFNVAKFAWQTLRSPMVTVPRSLPSGDGVQTSGLPEDGEPLPELVDLRTAIEANTAANLVLATNLREFREVFEKSTPAPVARIVPAAAAPTPLSAARVAARAVALLKPTKV